MKAYITHTGKELFVVSGSKDIKTFVKTAKKFRKILGDFIQCGTVKKFETLKHHIRKSIFVYLFSVYDTVSYHVMNKYV